MEQKFETTDICKWQDGNLLDNGYGFAELSVMHFWPTGFDVKTVFCLVWLLVAIKNKYSTIE